MSNEVLAALCALALAVSGCSRQQSDWEKARAANNTDSYELFLKKYPSGEFTAQAQARVKELYEERDWQKARDSDTAEAYQGFLKQYPEGKWTEEARIRVENFTLAQAPSGTPSGADTAPGAVPGATPGAASGATPGAAPAAPAAALPKPAPAPAIAAAAVAKPQIKSAVKPAGTPVKPAATAAAAGSYGVQLGAFKSGADAADKRWAELQKKYPGIFGALTSRVLPLKTSAGRIYRLQATGLTQTSARSICNRMKAQAQVCMVVIPTHDVP
jgi:cell division septation protein DedD